MIKNIYTLTSKERSKQWYEANKGSADFFVARRTRLLNWRNKYPERYLWQRAKERAKRFNLEFTITPEDIVIPFECPALKVPMIYGTVYAPSVDKINPEKGYTKENIQVISKKANAMKRNASEEELRNFARWALKTSEL